MDGYIDFESFTPLYHQLKLIMKENIESSYWVPDDKIPSENELMSSFNISRNTVKKALDELVQEGALKRVKGKGTFVTKPKFEQSLAGFYSFSKVMESQGIKSKDIIISIKDKLASSHIANQLKIYKNDEVIELQRLRCANEEAIIFETSYMPKNLIPFLSQKELENSSLYDYFEKEYNIFVTSAKETFEPVLTQEYESFHLGVANGLPALLLDRLAYNSKGKPVEFCRSIVRGDRCRFYTNLL